jgi:ATP-binding cassette, subfamily B, bacterial
LTLLVLLIVPVVIVPILFYGRRVRRLSRDSQDTIAAFGAYAEETINAIRTVQAFTHEAIDRTRFGTRVETAFAVARRRIAVRAVLTGLVILLAFGAIGLVLWIGGRDVLAGRISAGDLSAFVFYAVVVAMAVGTLSEVWGDVQRASGAAAAITELLEIAGGSGCGISGQFGLVCGECSFAAAPLVAKAIRQDAAGIRHRSQLCRRGG